MIELHCIYKGGIALQGASWLDGKLLTENFVPGERVFCRLFRPRSNKRNRFFHALVEAAYDNRTEGHGPDLAHWRALKGWLLVQVGHVNERRSKVPKSLGALSQREARVAGLAIAYSLRYELGDEAYVGISFDGKSNEWVFRYPASLKFHDMDEDEFSQLVDKVVAVITTEIIPGMEAQAILDMAKAKNGGGLWPKSITPC